MRFRTGVALAVALVLAAGAPALAAPQGEMTWAVHVSLAPSWFDPAETPSVITPFMLLYAMHDALVKPIFEPAFLSGYGPRVEESGFGLIAGYPFTSPYEELRLKRAKP